jgi:hypothetical protein
MNSRRLRAILSILRGEPDAVVRHGRPIFLLAWALVATVWLFGVGAITAVFTMGLGASAGSLQKWKSERGLWMLACVFLVPLVVFYVCWMTNNVLDQLRGAQPAGLAIVLDAAAATLVMQAQIRFLINVGRQNYQYSRLPNEC